MNAADNTAMIAARDRLAPQLRGAVPVLREVPEATSDPAFDARSFMEQRRGNYAAIVTGSPSAPEVVGTNGQIRNAVSIHVAN